MMICLLSGVLIIVLNIDLTVRAWTRAENYWDVFYTMNERFYRELPAHGLHFPFPQLDVHMDPTAK